MLAITLHPLPAQCQPPLAVISTSQPLTTVATAYCLRSKTTSGRRPQEIHVPGGKGCIALSRKLARDMGLWKGPGKYDYKFGTIIHLDGHGLFVFADLMPSRWKGYRVDVWKPDVGSCKVFGVQRRWIKVMRK